MKVVYISTLPFLVSNPHSIQIKQVLSQTPIHIHSYIFIFEGAVSFATTRDISSFIRVFEKEHEKHTDIETSTNRI